MHKSRSFPERLHEAAVREHKEREVRFNIQTETLDRYRAKDHERTEQLARIGSPSSTDIEVVVHVDWRARCCHWVSRMVDYFLEREEETRRQDEIIQRKSYAGFYYFIKWFIRAFFFLVFTTLGTIAGKEIGCEIKDHGTCETSAIELVDSSPHIIASIIGSIFGLLTGQWIGRYIWDHTTKCTQRCLRRTEKWADRSKAFLILMAAIVYASVTASFATVFFFFVDLGQDDENIIGGIVGGCIGLVCAVLAYRKSSSCRSGEQTPMVRGVYNDDEPEELFI
jgi:hypothetical protein